MKKKYYPPTLKCIIKIMNRYNIRYWLYLDEIEAALPHYEAMGLTCYEAYLLANKELKAWREPHVEFDETNHFSKVPIANEIPIFQKTDIHFLKEKLPERWRVQYEIYYKSIYAMLYAAKFADWYDLKISKLPKIVNHKVKDIEKTKDSWFESFKEVYPKYAELYSNREPIKIVSIQELAHLRAVGDRKG